MVNRINICYVQRRETLRSCFPTSREEPQHMPLVDRRHLASEVQHKWWIHCEFHRMIVVPVEDRQVQVASLQKLGVDCLYQDVVSNETVGANGDLLPSGNSVLSYTISCSCEMGASRSIWNGRVMPVNVITKSNPNVLESCMMLSSEI